MERHERGRPDRRFVTDAMCAKCPTTMLVTAKFSLFCAEHQPRQSGLLCGSRATDDIHEATGIG